MMAIRTAAMKTVEAAVLAGRNVLLIGPPGSGKMTIARSLPAVLPPLSRDEWLEVTALYSIAGMSSPEPPGRPFRAPHHTISTAAMVGGGRVPRPGEVSLADHGVLFLDDLPEFSPSVLNALCTVLTIKRSRGAATFPARFIFVAAMNPCPCGWARTPRCRCASERVREYAQLVSPIAVAGGVLTIDVSQRSGRS